MPVKDYYRILGVTPGTDIPAIKKAFRRLAMEHHPDKSHASAENSVYFQELQEAYQTLTDPYKREQYLYNRWLEKSMGHQLDQAMSAEEILLLFIKAEQYFSQTDHYRTNSNLLLHQLLQTFSERRINTILEGKDEQQILSTLELAMKLSNRLNANEMEKSIQHFGQLLAQKPYLLEQWMKLLKMKKKDESREKWTLPMMLFITILICLAIYWISRS
jgi:curved DNA-binding protein CbpA